jgi:predicted Zn-dependent peptidase
MRNRTITALAVGLALLAGSALHAQPASEPLPPNPFSGFESYRLPNGMRVWFGYLPGSTVTSMAVTVPYGRDQDPPGREQTAHFLEHVLLSDRHGGAEIDLARELTRRGGTHNAVTGPTWTHYLLSIGSDEAAYGAQWLHGVLAPRQFSDDLVNRNRQPVAIEVNARTAVPLSGLLNAYINHPRLRPTPFWQREFGLAAQEERGADQSAGIRAITAADLRTFYDSYYTPSEMTLVIVSGTPRPVLQPVLDSTFGTLPWRPAPEPAPPLHPRTGEARAVSWHAGRSTRVTLRYRIADLNGRDQLRLIFIEDLLRHRLMERLRRGDAKFVYSVGAGTAIRGSAAFFQITADMDAAHETLTRGAIQDELDRLSRAAGDTLAFYADRDALSRRVRIENAAPASLRQWALDRFHRPDLHDAFPDVGEYYATVGPDSIAALAARLFVPANRIVRVDRPLPLPVALLVPGALLLAAAAGLLYRRIAFRPADMARIRYVARLRPPLPARLLAVGLAVAGAIVGGRLLVAAIHIASAEWLLRVDSFALFAAACAALVFSATFAGFALAGAMHRKVLVFEDEIRLKSPTWTATVIPASELRDARIVDSPRGLALRRRVLPPASRGVFLQLADRSGYLLRSRSPEALSDALQRLVTRPPADLALDAAPDAAPAHQPPADAAL